MDLTHVGLQSDGLTATGAGHERGGIKGAGTGDRAVQHLQATTLNRGSSSGSVIHLCADRTRAYPVNDPENRELAISCGYELNNPRKQYGHNRMRCQFESKNDPQIAPKNVPPKVTQV